MSRRLLWFLLLIIAAVAFAVVLVPALVIQPFRPQSPRGLEISFFLKRLAPIFTIVALIACLTLVIKLWRGARWSRIALILLMIPAMLSAWFARQNHFEWMFNPLAQAGYVRADAVAFVADSDLVMAVARNGDAAAYPIRQLAYHHVVQDNVGGVPIVITY
ncbi:MAG: hypothetical protein QOE82_1236 [Thermoanaerobaculia bacterium]|jgi:uncharacterized membrane protein YhaH (DUF805 family)|nr:hypothetical protein [Thermoanaerobaculia bacterium]